MLPASPKIFHGRESELSHVLDILLQDSPRIVLLGPGGMGKTSLAISALHHPDISSKYVHRYFVSCQSAPSCSELMTTIASHIGVDHDLDLARKLVRQFSYGPASLLELLSLLADVPQLAVLITMRGAERPGRVNWTRPHLLPLSPLSDSAALQTFIDIADDPYDDATVQQLLNLTGNLPLAISLISSVAAYDGCDTALSRWKTESTRLLSDGYDKASSLDISIMLSLSSSRMNPQAQELLSILSMLPDGLSDADLVQSKLPISNILSCRATLVRTSLAYTHDQRLKVLVPIREYIYKIYPPSPELKFSLRAYFHKVVQIWDTSSHPAPTGTVPPISDNLGNLNSVFLDAMQTDYPDMAASLHSTLLLNSFYRRKLLVCCSVLRPLSEKIVHWQDNPVYGLYLIECLQSLPFLTIVEPETHVERGSQYFSQVGNELHKAVAPAVTVTADLTKIADRRTRGDRIKMSRDRRSQPPFLAAVSQNPATLTPTLDIAYVFAYRLRRRLRTRLSPRQSPITSDKTPPTSTRRRVLVTAPPAGRHDIAEWYNSLGGYYHPRSEHAKAKQYKKLALSLAEAGGTPTMVGRHALQGLAQILRSEGDCLGARIHAQKAHRYANSLGDLYGEAQTLTVQAYCCMGLGDFQQAAVLLQQSKELLRLCGLDGGLTDLTTLNYEGEIHLLRTEYLEARTICELTASRRPPGHPPRAYTAFAHFNIAYIDMAIGAEPDLIRHNVDIALQQFNDLEGLPYPLGGPLCDTVYADLYLIQGERILARTLFQSSFLATRDAFDEAAILCLERLADVGTAMADVNTTLCWAGLFLASSMQKKNRLTTMKALRFLGDIFAAMGDNGTALTLFKVAREGFALMGVHRWQGDCLVRIAKILEAQGDVFRSVDFLREARPLFERSSQKKEIEWVDSKLESLVT
ncbi:hypothetical protein GGX14DRAFT_696431 [Mycena pura]|uniref:TPR-like protein n=1 Tax=Mycena pura TaxID=153505 RepID=A0AAD6VKW9_9AGAR|nr:hypothetical protein GGX14DRAFT_696431 [Mycena pura]